jgi:NAD-dependent SIR2 family protein deacetylase
VSEINGIESGIVACIGCGNEFEDFWFVTIGPDPMPVCPDCEASMEPV